MRNPTTNAGHVADVAIALAARLRALAENLERVDQVAAVSFMKEVNCEGGYIRTDLEITLVEEVR